MKFYTIWSRWGVGVVGGCRNGFGQTDESVTKSSSSREHKNVTILLTFKFIVCKSLPVDKMFYWSKFAFADKKSKVIQMAIFFSG